MNQEIHEKLEQFLKDKNVQSIEEANEVLGEFFNLYNSGNLEYEDSNKVKAYKLLEKAEEAKSKKTKIKYINEALELWPECLEAKMLLAMQNEDFFKILLMLEKALEEEKEILTKERYFDKSSIGKFYGIFETRPYIKCLHTLALMYKSVGMINKSITTCKEIIRLNNNDNLGARYLLMGLYAYKEDEDSLKKLCKKYEGDSLSYLVSYLILYYKRGNYNKAKEYLDKINKYNKHFLMYFNGKMEESDVFEGFYQPHDSSEVLMVLEELDFLFNSVMNLDEFILKNGEVQ